MRLHLYTATFVLTSLLSYSQPSEEAVNRILTEVINDNPGILDSNYKLVNGFSSAIQYSPLSYLHPPNFEKLNPYFSNADIEYYRKQIVQNKNIKLNSKQLKTNYSTLKKKKVTEFIVLSESEEIRGNEFDYYGEFSKRLGNFQEFGLPLISKDEKYVMIRYIRVTDGKSNYGFMKIYERTNSWVPIKTILEWNE